MQLWEHSATELAAQIKVKQVSSREVIDAHLARIEQVNPHLNAVVVVMAQAARVAADRADFATMSGAELPALHGVPFTVKENLDVAGMATTSGLIALKDAVAAIDCPIVERMRAAGAIPIGRTNLPDLGLRIHTDSSLHGLTRNPWHPNRTAGGSSGGEASAIASGMSPLGLGNDIGGSLRNPAHCCGIASLKPTTNRLPMATVIPPQYPVMSSQVMLADGPMARRVADLRLALSIMAGPHARDPYVVPSPLSYPDTHSRVKVAVMAEPAGGTTDAGIAGVIRNSAAILSDAGYDVTEIDPPMFLESLLAWSGTLGADLEAQRPLLELVLGPDALAFVNNGNTIFAYPTVESISALHSTRHEIAQAWSAFMDIYPIILAPVWTEPAFEHGWDIASVENTIATLQLFRPILPANVLGLPAAVVPGGLANGMPVGVQIIARRFRDDQALAVAEAIENSVGIITPIDPLMEA